MKYVSVVFLVLIFHSSRAQWSGTNPVYFTGGNVGIGTSSPQNKFEIRHGADIPLAFIRQDKNNGGSSNVFSLMDDRGYSGNNTGTSFKVESWKGYGMQGGALANFVTINDGVATSRLLIDNHTGNVGIGTESPTATLHVYIPSRRYSCSRHPPQGMRA